MPPIICFGQQPCGFFPKRFLVAKIFTARRLQKEMGGEIVFFFHDADHDLRETKTLLRHRKFGDPMEFNFNCENKVQRKYSPLFLKRVPKDWQPQTARKLADYVDGRWVEAFKGVTAMNAADFCLDMYRRMGLMEGIRVVRSGDAAVRRAACAVEDYFVDVPYSSGGGEIVRARLMNGVLKLHEGGDSYVMLADAPPPPYAKEQISPTRDTRLRWMQSVIGCTHYIAGAGEQAYLNKGDAPEIQFVNRDPIERHEEAWAEVA